MHKNQMVLYWSYE